MVTLNSFTITTQLPARPEQVYQDWMSSAGHAAFTGSPASISSEVGGAFTAWDGYISGRTLALEPGRRIVQAWRTTEFTAESPDSLLEVLFESEAGGTRLTLLHSSIPEGQADSYLQGWIDYYFNPLAAYYSQLAAA